MSYFDKEIIFDDLGNTTTGVTTIGDKIIHHNIVFRNIDDLNRYEGIEVPIINAIEIDWNNAELPSIKNLKNNSYHSCYHYAPTIKDSEDLLTIVEENQRQIDDILLKLRERGIIIDIDD